MTRRNLALPGCSVAWGFLLTRSRHDVHKRMVTRSMPIGERRRYASRGPSSGAYLFVAYGECVRDWLLKRRRRHARQEARLRDLHYEHIGQLEAKDPDAPESSRNWFDYDGGSWRVDVVLAGTFPGLTVTVSVFVGLFVFIETLTGDERP